MGAEKPKHWRRINLCVEHLEARPRTAADASGEPLTGFLLAAGAERADAVLEPSGRITLSTPSFERFVAALDDRPEPMPTLTRYVNEPGPLPSQ